MPLFKTKAVAAEAQLSGLQEQLRVALEAQATAETKLSAYEGEGKPTLEAITGELATARQSLSEVTTERDAYKAAIEDGGLFEFSNPDGGNPTLSINDAGKVRFVNDEATRLTASGGHRQLPMSVDTNALGNGGADASAGTGRYKQTWAK